MAKELSESLYATVAYADIFEYSLSADEAARWFIGAEVKGIPRPDSRWIRQKGRFLTLRGRGRLGALRRLRQQAARQKWLIAKKAAAWLRFVPTITLVGVTGALAMNNVTSDDDIDLFIVTKKDTLWTTRFLATLLLDMLGLRRKPNQTHVRDKICLNMFMSEEGLRVTRKDQDLFSAHEVLQMTPLWERGSVHYVFLRRNAWARIFLPNAWREAISSASERRKIRTPRFDAPFLYLFRFVEPLSKRLQAWYMRRHRTTERVTSHVLQFHPRDARVWVKEAFEKRLKLRDIPLDKFFYDR